MTLEPEAESCPVREWLRSCELHGGSFTDPCGLGTLMPKKRLKVRRRFAVNADALSRTWMNELKTRRVESDASNSPFQLF